MFNFIEINRKDGKGGYLVTGEKLAAELLKNPDYVLGKGGSMKRWRLALRNNKHDLKPYLTEVIPGVEEHSEGAYVLDKDREAEVLKITEIYERRISELKRTIKILETQYPGERLIFKDAKCNCERMRNFVKNGVMAGEISPNNGRCFSWTCPEHGYETL